MRCPTKRTTALTTPSNIEKVYLSKRMLFAREVHPPTPVFLSPLDIMNLVMQRQYLRGILEHLVLSANSSSYAKSNSVNWAEVRNRTRKISFISLRRMDGCLHYIAAPPSIAMLYE